MQMFFKPVHYFCGNYNFLAYIYFMHLFFFMDGSLSWKQLLTNHSYPTEYFCGLVLVCSAVLKLSIYEWIERYPKSLCILMMLAIPVFSFYLSYKDKVTTPVHEGESDTKAFLSTIGCYYCHFKKSCWCSFLMSHTTAIQRNICIFQEVVCEALTCIRCWPRNILTAYSVCEYVCVWRKSSSVSDWRIPGRKDQDLPVLPVPYFALAKVWLREKSAPEKTA